MEEAIKYGLGKIGFTSLKKNQEIVIKHYMNGKDVLFCSPTGSGKSLLFEIAPFLHKHVEKKQTGCTCIVISPLAALMKSQSQDLVSRGILALYLKEGENHKLDVETEQKISSGHYELIFSSPETLLKQHRDVVLNSSKKGYLKTIFIDEAHCIKKFGTDSKGGKENAYRPMYGSLGELRSLAGPQIPVVALTATASKSVRQMIAKDLCMDANMVEIVINPNKANIKYWVLETSRVRGDIARDFDWLVELLRTGGIRCPRMIIFFRKIDHISDVYEHLETSLGSNAYINYDRAKPNDDRNRLFDMYHLKTDEEVKESIIDSYQNPNGHVRVVLCSTSFSMGLNVKGVNTVIHYGACNDLDDFLQETGRAGRNEHESAHSIVMKYKQCLTSKHITQDMKEYIKTNLCRRQLLLKPFTDKQVLNEDHDCCDNCALKCNCLCQCKSVHECTCTLKCPNNTSLIYSRMKYFIGCDPEESEESDLNDGFQSDSDIDDYRKTKPSILQYSSDE